MNSEDSKVIEFMIYLFIYVFFKKELDVTIDIKYPTYDKLKDANFFWKFLVNLRRFLSILINLTILVFLYFYKVNSYIFNFCLLMMISFIMYLAFDERLIYLFIPKNSTNDEIVNIMDIYGTTIRDIIFLLYSIYVVFKIFNPLKSLK
jgi:hypothetical protein